MIKILVFAFCLVHFTLGQMGKSTITKSEDGSPMSGTISMGPPDLTDEETQANFMPDGLRCDACVAISDRFMKALRVRIRYFIIQFV